MSPPSAEKISTEWGIRHNQGIATCSSEADARERFPAFVARYEGSFRNQVEPRVVRRTVTEWADADASAAPTSDGAA